jgi:broad specificity phosphatase PhoE
MRLILIRHAQSRHTLEKIIAGPLGCRGLTETGFGQAHALAERLHPLGKVDLLLSSPVLRARQTAEIIAPALGLVLVEDARLTEQAPGAADGLTWAEYETRYGAFDLAANPDRPFAPGGESWNEYIARVPAVFETLARENPGKTVVAVTHAGFIVVSFLLLFGVFSTSANRAWIDPAFASLTEWEWLQERGVWRLNCYNA